MSQTLYGIKHNRFIRVPLDWAKCGTAANYRAHLRRGEPACAACKAANTRAKVDYISSRAKASS